MNGRVRARARARVGAIGVVAIITLIYTSSCTRRATNISDEQRLKGFWKLNAFEVQTDSGWVTYPWNPNGTGFLLYDGDGHGALHISPNGFKDFEWSGTEGIDHMDSSELHRVLSTFVLNYNYIAEYELDTGHHIVSHTRLAHSRPEEWGKTVQRQYKFVGPDTLLLFPVEGDQIRRLTWVRSKD